MNCFKINIRLSDNHFKNFTIRSRSTLTHLIRKPKLECSYDTTNIKTPYNKKTLLAAQVEPAIAHILQIND